uniref:(northern house mosquito) hypothetical protein n=1 Tax=Culex pipiens TaxID=7175 RepID=A0A8D8FE41_CULPI
MFAQCVHSLLVLRHFPVGKRGLPDTSGFRIQSRDQKVHNDCLRQFVLHLKLVERERLQSLLNHVKQRLQLCMRALCHRPQRQQLCDVTLHHHPNVVILRGQDPPRTVVIVVVQRLLVDRPFGHAHECLVQVIKLRCWRIADALVDNILEPVPEFVPVFVAAIKSWQRVLLQEK